MYLTHCGMPSTDPNPFFSPNLCKPKSWAGFKCMSECVSRLVDIILCFLNIFFLYANATDSIRPPTMRHFVVVVVVGQQPGDFAGHKSEIVFWHMNMLCIKRRRKTRPQTEPESDSHFEADDRHFYYYQCMYEFLSGASCLCPRLMMTLVATELKLMLI